MSTLRWLRGLLARLSLRTRLVLLTVVLLTAGLVASTVVVHHLLRAYLQEQTDRQLVPAADLFARIPPSLSPNPTTTDRPLAKEAAERLSALNLFDTPAVVYLDAAGRSVGAAGTQPDTSPQLPAPAPTTVVAHGTDPFTVPGQDGGPRWRVVVRPLTDTARLLDSPSDPKAVSVAVATSTGEADATVDRLWTISTTVAAALLAVLAAVGWFAVRSGFRPLTSIEETATAIAAGDLSHRVPDLASPQTEIGRLATVINNMLVQIETAFAARADSEARMRRFVADASHELRTPLVGIKGSTDLYRMGALPTTEDIDRTMDRISGEAERLARLVEDMLQLARLDETPHHTGIPLQLAPTDLRTLAVDALRDVRALDPTRPVELTGPDDGAPASSAALADEAALRQVVSNLVGNAVTHTPGGTPIRIGVGTVDGHAVLEVADQGPGMTDEQAKQVFERFYRVDSSRTRSAGAGAGLGLSIVHSLVTAHHGRVELTTSPGQGATFRLLLPPVTDTIR
ncbi:HAMP domain-containing histidine kinase [Streptomyces sp. CA-210063]|uniref:sensor histidine kinase n=1 Tax=Streptomyces sp. CA-210063 TaxID=2801029 RepID=UPI00214C2779|nr:HAMP domain-containing sensor histidine kinase [Streptomyces sp. CA-210063]UUU29479.1 HAMP domain-containing histidine kinase [Streptomyces sp. CA-210063]